MIDGFTIPVCRLARAKRYKLLLGLAEYGYYTAKQENDKGFHRHVIIDYSGTITGLIINSANTDECVAMFDLTEHIQVLRIGDKGYIRHKAKTHLQDHHDIDLKPPLRSNMKDDRGPVVVNRLIQTRRLVETVM